MLFPPFLPFRIVWGNIINFTSTLRAYIQYFTKNKKDREVVKKMGITIKDEKLDLNKNHIIPIVRKDEKKYKWSKTEHDFFKKNVLERYHRKLGDILIEKEYLTIAELK